jgi:ribonuclease HII
MLLSPDNIYIHITGCEYLTVLPDLAQRGVMARKILINDEIGLLGGTGGLEDRLRLNGYHDIIGADEAGRGPLAGPVVAAAVLIPEEIVIEGLEDSKKMTPARRDFVFDRIVASDAAYAVGIVDNEMIDRINILRASLRAMALAVGKLKCRSGFVLVDGNHTIPNLDFPQLAVIGGDAVCPSISAASIIAKVTRDRIMDHYAKLYPQFTFSRHRGYPTADHIKELRQNGPTPIHRVSFKPVQEMVSQLEMSLTR